MKLIANSIKFVQIFTKNNVYSKKLLKHITGGNYLAIGSKISRIFLSNSYTHIAYQFEISFTTRCLIVRNF